MRQTIVKACVGLVLVSLVGLAIVSWMVGTEEGSPIGQSSDQSSDTQEMANPSDGVISPPPQTITGQLEQDHQGLKIEMKQMELKLGKLKRKKREMEQTQSVLALGLDDEFARLQANLEALPDGRGLLDPGLGVNTSGGLSGRKRMETLQWQSVMDNYERETGISRSEAEAILRQE